MIQNTSWKYDQETRKLLKEKKSALISAEREYWEIRNQMMSQRLLSFRSGLLEFDLKLPDSISSTIWALTDGAIFVRYKTSRRGFEVKFRAEAVDIKNCGSEMLLVSVGDLTLPLRNLGIEYLGGEVTFIDCNLNGRKIDFLQISSMKYEDSSFSSASKAIRDFHIFLLGVGYFGLDQSVSFQSDSIIEKLNYKLDQFDEMLEVNTREEEIHRFLKDHPFIVHPYAEIISKKALGEDFITDFVLVETQKTGSRYILVELEQSSHPIFTKKLQLTNEVNHAYLQTRQWDVWLQENSAYIRGKLPNFETPKYLIIIGRSVDFSEDQNKYFRSYNRGFNGAVELITYDDLSSRCRSMISVLSNIS